MPKSDFPKKYLEDLAKNHQDKVLENLRDPADKILMYSGSLLNWVGEYINDESIQWSFKKLSLFDITLTGTSPAWNKYTLEKAQKEPRKFRELLKNPKIRRVFKNAKFANVPILVRKNENKLKVLDGMNRVIAAARDEIDEIWAYVGERKGEPEPVIEPHVVYDLIRAFQQRGGSKEDFVASLRFLIKSYSNTKELLEERFNHAWVNDRKLSILVQKAILTANKKQNLKSSQTT